MSAVFGSCCCCSSSSQLQAYALGEMSKEHLGYSRQGCISDTATISLKDASSDVRMYLTVGIIGFISAVISNVMASVVFLQVLLKALSQKMESCSYSFDYYGMFWGMSAILCPFLLLLLYADITHVFYIIVSPDIGQTENVRYMSPIILAFPIIFCAPVAIYFGIKYNLPTPSVYLLPAKLLCCSEKRARALILSLTLWFDLVAANFIIGHVVFVVLAFPVAPFAVAVNVMLLVLSLMCLTYIMALVFTVCASVSTRRCLRSSADCVVTIRAAILIPLLLSVICFSFLIAFSSQFVNAATQQNSFPMLLKSLFAPVFLFVMSLFLKRFMSVWVHWSLGRVPNGEEMNQPPQHGCNRYQAMDNAVVDNVH